MSAVPSKFQQRPREFISLGGAVWRRRRPRKVSEIPHVLVILPLFENEGCRKKWAPNQSPARLCQLASHQKADDAIDYAVAFSEFEKVGEHGDVDEPLSFVHPRNEPSLRSVMPPLENAMEIV